MSHVRRLSAAVFAGILATTLIAQARAAGDQSDGTTVYSQALADLNLALAASGHANIRIDRAEISVTADGWQGATTIIANNRTHQLGSLFVARDPRRGGFSDISYLVDQSEGSVLAFGVPPEPAVVLLPNGVTEPLIDASMLRWQNSRCPGPDVFKVADDGSDPDIVDNLVLGGTPGTPKADITHAGWLSPAFFNLIATGGGSFILGATFTFIFVDGAGNPTDIDRNGRADVAIREIYYNRAFGWSEGPARPMGVDIASVVTHEAGHAFGLGHFGKVFLDQNDKLKYAPRAVMNAVYVSPFAELAGTDTASFCSIWASKK